MNDTISIHVLYYVNKDWQCHYYRLCPHESSSEHLRYFFLEIHFCFNQIQHFCVTVSLLYIGGIC